MYEIRFKISVHFFWGVQKLQSIRAKNFVFHLYDFYFNFTFTRRHGSFANKMEKEDQISAKKGRKNNTKKLTNVIIKTSTTCFVQ